MITLTANLETILGGTALAGYLRITLCGIGPVVPSVPGVGVISDAGIPRLIGPQGSGPLSQQLYGNDVIVPAGTFYEIAVLDENKNCIQSGQYQFTGSGTFDLSTAQQIIDPYGFLLDALAYLPCTGTLPGHTFMAAGQVLAVSYNGVLMPINQAAPIFSYTLGSDGKTITLNFTAQTGERIDAFVIE